MKNSYQKPELSVFSTGFQLMDSLGVGSPGNGTTKNGITTVGAKSRDDDEEYYESESGNYGDLW